jgi:hypothetical protein
LLDELLGGIKDVLAVDKFFVKTKRTRNFLIVGTLANILSALIVLVSGPLPISLLPAIIGGTLSIIMLRRCIVSVKPPVAIVFGAGVALWWGYVAASVAMNTPGQYLVAPSFLFAGAISLGMHVWYVNNRLKN